MENCAFQLPEAFFTLNSQFPSSFASRNSLLNIRPCFCPRSWFALASFLCHGLCFLLAWTFCLLKWWKHLERWSFADLEFHWLRLEPGQALAALSFWSPLTLLSVGFFVYRVGTINFRSLQVTMGLEETTDAKWRGGTRNLLRSSFPPQGVFFEGLQWVSGIPDASGFCLVVP